MAQAKQVEKLFEAREEQILARGTQLFKDFARKELALLEFEMFYESMIPKRDKHKAQKSVNKLRKDRWAEALKQAKGDEEKAIFIYDAS